MSRRAISVALAFLASRFILIAITVFLDADDQGRVVSDVNLYGRWLQDGIDAGAGTAISGAWQYPPAYWLGLAPISLVPEELHRPITVLMLLAVDAIVCALLVRAAARDRLTWTSPWFWVAAAPLIGPALLFRLDLLPTACAVAALVATSAVRSAGWSAAGTALKLWPVVTMFSLPRAGTAWRPVIGWWVGVTAGLTALAWVVNPSTVIALANQSERGLQLESVVALPWQAAGVLGRSVDIDFSFGAFVVGGSVGSTLGQWMSIAAIAAIAAVAIPWWRGRAGWAGSPDVVLVATVALVVTSRVLSPQFMIWIAGVAAVVVGGSGPLRRLAWWLVPIFAATGITLTIGYEDVATLSGWPTSLLIARNLGLVAWTIAAVLTIERSARADRGETSAGASPAARQAH